MKNIIKTMLFILLLSNCTKDEVTSREYPRLRTKPVEMVTNTQAIFKGEITYVPQIVDDYGFVWSSTITSFTINSGEKISMGSKKRPGKFEVQVDVSFSEEGVSYVRSYAQAGDYVVYGDLVEFSWNE